MVQQQHTDCVSCGRRFAVASSEREHYCPGCEKEHCRAAWAIIRTARRRVAKRLHARRLEGRTV